MRKSDSQWKSGGNTVNCRQQVTRPGCCQWNGGKLLALGNGSLNEEHSERLQGSILVQGS